MCCQKGVTEDETHLLTTCEKLEEERKAWYSDIGIEHKSKMPKVEIMRKMLAEKNLKTCAKNLEIMFQRRSELIYIPENEINQTAEQQTETNITQPMPEENSDI